MHRFSEQELRPASNSLTTRFRHSSLRHGYQWTGKVAQKTITVSLGVEQFQALGQAIENERKLWKMIREMEKVSRQILFGKLPDTHRRKRLARKKVLGTI